ncbi:MAG: alpha-L-fucosidase [Chthonomonadales bacterium]
MNGQGCLSPKPSPAITGDEIEVHLIVKTFILTTAMAAVTVCSAMAQTKPAPKETPKKPVMMKPYVDPKAETPAQFARRTQWWREARFGMFIHWGVYAVPADATMKDGKSKGIAEWFYNNKQFQMADYQKFAPKFNPANFDAKKWVRTAKDAGMKYIVITSKHHDGFDMFGTKLNSDWNIVSATPFKRDPLKELSIECQKQGIKLCFYHSIMDWHHADYTPRRAWETETRPATNANYDRYVDYMKGQLRELCTNYGAIGVLWFDGEWENTWSHDRGMDLYKYVRSLQPSILVNNRVDKGRSGMQGMNKGKEFVGDFGTPEQEIPPQGFADGRLWESCMTMNDTWGYARNDNNWKSAESLIHNLIDIASKGGNYLLNVGPTELGEFPPAINERLSEMGNWMKKHNAGIYGTMQGPFKSLAFDGRCTVKGNRLYLHVFHWPDGGLRLEGLETKALSARTLDTGEKLDVSVSAAKPGTVYFSRPNKPLDKYATTVEVVLAGGPVVK